MERLILKLKNLNILVKDWIRKKEGEDRSFLLQFENQIMEILLRKLNANISVEERVLTIELELKKDALLKKEKDLCRLKSRAVWIEASDNNTIFFHRYTSNIKDLNTIWDITSPEGI